MAAGKVAGTIGKQIVKRPWIVPLTFLGSYFLYKQFTDKENGPVGPNVSVNANELTQGFDHVNLANDLFDKMKGINFIIPWELWEKLATAPKGIDVAMVYKLFNARATREGYDPIDTLTQWIVDEYTLPFTRERRAKENVLARLRSLNLN